MNQPLEVCGRDDRPFAGLTRLNTAHNLTKPLKGHVYGRARTYSGASPAIPNVLHDSAAINSKRGGRWGEEDDLGATSKGRFVATEPTVHVPQDLTPLSQFAGCHVR